MERSAGILLPVFSLPGPYGIGSLGREARAFAEFLHNAGQRWWQVLPVGPAGAGNSPYTSESTFAGTPLLIDLEDLRDRGLLTEAELSAARVPEGAPIDYAALYESREALLRRAFSRLGGAEAQSVRDFAAANPWLGEYALYRALKARFGQTAWFDWPDKDLLNRDPAALARACEALGGTPLSGADVGYTLPLFPFLPVQLRFWHGDEEFPPSLQLLWDEHTLQFMRYETTYYAANHLFTRLSEEA